MSINNIKIFQSKDNKWSLTVTDGKRVMYVAIPPRKNGFDFIDKNFKYHYDYKGCVSMGIAIKIEDSSPITTIIKNKLTRSWRLDECFKENRRYFKPKGSSDRERSRSVCELE